MKKAYERPTVELERFVVNEQLTSGCTVKVLHSDNSCFTSSAPVDPDSNYGVMQALLSDTTCSQICYNTATNTNAFS